MTRQQYWQGNEAIAYGALDAGARFYAGYPITPSSEIAEIVSREMPGLGGVYVQMEDEISSMAAILGAAAAGKRSFTATSGPGFSLMQENLGVGILAQIPCVVVDVQRFGPSTGLATKPAQGDVMQARWGTHGDHEIIALSPASVEECYTLTKLAFTLAERYRVPVIVLADERIGHLREGACIERTREPIAQYIPGEGTGRPYDLSGIYPGNIAPLVPFGNAVDTRFSGSMYGEDGMSNHAPDNAERFVDHLSRKIKGHADEIVRTRLWGDEQPDVTIITFGCTTRAACESMTRLQWEGLRVGVLQLVTLWPFAEEAVRQACERSKVVVVPEMNRGQVAGEVVKLTGGKSLIQVNKLNGRMIAPDEISRAVKEALAV